MVILLVNELGVVVKGVTLSGGYINHLIGWQAITQATRANPIIKGIETVEAEVEATEQLEMALQGMAFQ